MAYSSVNAMLNVSRQNNQPLWDVILQSDLLESGLTRPQSLAEMHHLWQVMVQTSDNYCGADRSASGFAGGDAAKVAEAEARGQLLTGGYLAQVMAEALKTAECNACMKRIVAAPTAGSCGVLPAVLLPLWRSGSYNEEAICRALYVSAGFGQVVAARATLAGAEGGCQAEVGAASAMAAAALVELRGGTAEQCAEAFAMALTNLEGLVCDPVAGLVEIPCIKRNVIGAMNAVSCADMALAGVVGHIPADEVIDAVKRGQIRRILLVGGCDGAHPGRNYYTELVKKAPMDTLILTLACGKFRFNDLDLGEVGGLPRILDMGQCNDAYSAVQVALALADAFGCGVNDLPLTLVLSWYEQKAVCILLTLLHLGIKNIRLGPTLPAFISPNVLNYLVENFGIAPITTPEEDLKQLLK